MYRILRKIKFLCIKLLINIYCLFKRRKSNKSIAIISCDAWKNKVLEDIKLKYYLYKSNINANIVSWEKEFDYSKYDSVIIRSVWGFDYKKFQKWLTEVNKNVNIINSFELIKNNFSKQEQFKLLDKYSISYIETKYLKCDKDFITNVKNIWETYYSNYKKIVIKPAISESGNNTFLLDKKQDSKNSIKLEELYNKSKQEESILMIQPFIEEIKNGEISVIAINGKISHAVVRYPGIFDNCNKVEEIKKEMLSSELMEVINKILDINEYKNHTYIRIDFVKYQEKYLVLELELIDPILFINTIKDKKERKKTYINLVKQIKKHCSIS